MIPTGATSMNYYHLYKHGQEHERHGVVFVRTHRRRQCCCVGARRSTRRQAKGRIFAQQKQNPQTAECGACIHKLSVGFSECVNSGLIWQKSIYHAQTNATDLPKIYTYIYFPAFATAQSVSCAHIACGLPSQNGQICVLVSRSLAQKQFLVMS